MGSAQKNNSPINLITADQTSDRSAAFNKPNNTAFFDFVKVRKYYIKIDGFRYLRDSVNVDYLPNKYLYLYGDHHNLFHKQYVGEPL